MGFYGNKLKRLEESVQVLKEDVERIRLFEQMLDEAYFGKSPLLLEIEKEIGELRKPENLSRFNDLNANPHTQRINRLFEQQYGMDIFSLQIEPSNEINAYTMPIATKFDVAFTENLARCVEATQQTGYRFKSGNNLCIECHVYLGLLKMANITNEEFTAIFLHELGHNFADAVYKDIRAANQQSIQQFYKSLVILVILNVLVLNIPNAVRIARYRKTNNNEYLRKTAEKHQNGPNKVGAVFKGIGAKLSDMKSFVNSVLSRLIHGKDIKVALWLRDIYGYKAAYRKSLGRQNEVIADKFAGMYGYGPAQGSALLKMSAYKSDAEKFVDRLPGGKKANAGFNDAIRKINDYDVHPYNVQRINEEIKLLEYELKRGCDPKYEKMIKDQIAELKALIKQATRITKECTDEEKADALWNAYINSNEPGAIDDDLEKKINDALEAAVDRSNEKVHKKNK